MSDFDLGSLQISGAGLDAFLGDNPEVVTPLVAGTKKTVIQQDPTGQAGTKKAAARGRRKIASLEQLSGFIRTAEDTLVHKSDRDLWALRKDGSGEFYIERMFDEAGAPLKG